MQNRKIKEECRFPLIAQVEYPTYIYSVLYSRANSYCTVRFPSLQAIKGGGPDLKPGGCQICPVRPRPVEDSEKAEDKSEGLC